MGDTVYLLGNEAGKQRATRTGTARRRHFWRTLFLSTGEITLAQKMGEAGKRATAGLGVRLPNLPADAGAGMGVFQSLHGRLDGAAFADELRDTARLHHGHAARVFLQQLTEHRATSPDKLRATLNSLRDAFLDRHVPEGATGQVRSVAGRFALIAAAGELARDYGVLPWPEGEALRAAGACLSAWLEQRGGSGSAEDAAALAQVRGFLEAHGESRFTPLTTPVSGQGSALPDVTRTINRVGFRRRVGGDSDERWEYWILPEAWKNEVCKGLDPRKTADLLAGRKFLLGGTDAIVLPLRRSRARASVGSTGCRARSWKAAMASEALRALARRYRERPAGTPGTRDPGATGSVADASEPKDFQEVVGHGTPSTPGTRQSNNVRQEEADAWGLTAADRAAGMTRLRETAPLQSRGPNPEPPDPAPPVSQKAGRCCARRTGRWSARCRAWPAAKLGRCCRAALARMLLHLLQGPAVVARARGTQRLALLDLSSPLPPPPRWRDRDEDMTSAPFTRQRSPKGAPRLTLKGSR